MNCPFVFEKGSHIMKCNNCNEEMVMDYEIKVHHAALLTYISLKKGKEDKQIKACICPKCGKVDFYTE